MHPEFTYSDFIGQILPSVSKDENVTFEFSPGALTSALQLAYADRSKPVFLVLEELSRGNVSAIFGDTFQLLDRGEDGMSRYPIFNKAISQVLPESEEFIREGSRERVRFPANLNILATVNLNDQNVAPMDTAFKRRFEWQYVSPAPALLPDGNINLDLNNPRLTIETEQGGRETDWLSFYTALNAFIVDRNLGLGRSEDRQLGQFFLTFASGVSQDTKSANENVRIHADEIVREIIRNKLLQYLWHDVEGHAIGGRSSSIFRADIPSFAELYKRFGTGTVFSDQFVRAFLFPSGDATGDAQ
ncbi:5-methylcytosine-specific restriction protein B [Microbacterium testaceum]|nr:5-methylcytosine-specific restriction protein B [Microbacterium testaceum]